jgi:hypothetical protein
MKIGNKNVDNLPDGTYYYCGNCKYWFGTREPAPSQKCPNCGRLWEQAQGSYIKETSVTTTTTTTEQETSSDAGVIVIILFLAGGCWVYSIVQPRVSPAWRNFQVGWSNFVGGVTSWGEFIGSIFLSFVALTVTTLLLFGLFRLLLYLLILIVFLIVSPFVTNKYYYPIQYRAHQALQEHGRLVGTLINLVSSFCALLIVSWIFQRPPDYWDFGIQLVIALIIESVILSTY